MNTFLQFISELFEHFVNLIGNIAWPLVLLAFFVVFHNPISSLLQKLIRVGSKNGFFGLEFDPQSKQETSEVGSETRILKNASESKQELERHYQQSGTELIIAREGEITTLMQGLDLNEAEKIRFLLRDYVFFEFCTFFERTIKAIWGSQYALLKFLNGRTPCPREYIEINFYVPAKAKYPGFFEHYTFEQYLEFLYSSNLIIKINPNNVGITKLGVEFLIYVVKSGQDQISLKNG
jgi:hypothetical protein